MPVLQLHDLHPGEKVEIVMRRHWFTLVHTFVYIFLLLVSGLYLFAFRNSFETVGISASVIDLLLIFYAAIFSLFIFIDWLSNELDFFIFTNKRLIGIEQLSFLNRVMSECSLDRVQEVNGFSKGLLANIFNFGTVTIHTASEKSEFEMLMIAEPLESARKILNIVQVNKGTPDTPVATPAPTSAV